MQTLRNKTIPIIYSRFRLSLRVGVILALIMTGFLVQKQPMFAAGITEDSGAILEPKSNSSTLQDQVSQSDQFTGSLLSVLLPQEIYLPLVINLKAPLTNGVTYYVSPTGNDSKPGTTPESAWKTLAKVNAFPFQPGDTILFERNGVWTGPGLADSHALVVDREGAAGAPITYGAYGVGSLPVLMNPPLDNGSVVVTVHASWIVFENFIIKDAHFAGILNSDSNSHNNIFRNLEITNVGEGIALNGTYHLVTQNYIHDLFMVVNTPGEWGDDWGANGVDIQSAHNEISYNRFVNCEAPSYDYGMGGGAVEIYQMGDYTSIHHNWSLNTAGYVEVASHAPGSAKNVTIHHNVIINSSGFTYISLSTTQIQDFRVENNTIVDLRTRDPLPGSFISFGGNPIPDTYIFRNNIVYISDYYTVSTFQFTHQNNLYYFLNPRTTLGFSLGEGELIADPQFTNLTSIDFHLMSTSPAINAGLPLGYLLDFDGLPVPTDHNPDIGAFQY